MLCEKLGPVFVLVSLWFLWGLLGYWVRWLLAVRPFADCLCTWQHCSIAALTATSQNERIPEVIWSFGHPPFYVHFMSAIVRVSIYRRGSIWKVIKAKYLCLYHMMSCISLIAQDCLSARRRETGKKYSTHPLKLLLKHNIHPFIGSIEMGPSAGLEPLWPGSAVQLPEHWLAWQKLVTALV